MRFYGFLIAGVCMVAAGGSTFSAGAPEGAIDVIAHRGASAYAPENTLSAFRLAAKMKAHWFELDCTLTKDGEILVIHDDTIDRTTGTAGQVKDFTLAELKRLEAGKWYGPKFEGEPLPTLGEALDLAKGRIGVYIEIKNSDDDRKLLKDLEGLAEGQARLLPESAKKVMDRIEASGTRNLELTRKTIQAVRDRGMKDQIVIQSFSPIVCAVALVEAPEMRTELLGSPSRDDASVWENYLLWARLLDAPGFNVNRNAVTPELLEQFHKAGKTMAVWTVNDEAEMEKFARMGVDAIITDHPDVCRKVLKRVRRQGR